VEALEHSPQEFARMVRDDVEHTTPTSS
jgi:hypothetical protein